MTCTETPATATPKESAAGWKNTLGWVMGAVFWMSMGALVYFGFSAKKPQQGLQITNTGSQSVDIYNASASWGDNKTLTLHPGMTGYWNFRDTDQFRITVSDENPPQPGTTPPASPPFDRSQAFGTPLIQNTDGSGTIFMRHASRTAEVRINEAGQIKFEFTDL